MLIRRIIIGAVIIGFLLAMLSCSGEWHLRQARKKAPHLFKSDSIAKIDVRVDTAWVPVPVFRDVVSLPDSGMVVDTIDHDDRSDTPPAIVKFVYIEKDGGNDSLSYEIECPPCPEITIDSTTTIEKKETIEIPPPKPGLKKRIEQWFIGWLIINGIIGLIGAGFYLLKKRFLG